MIWYMAPIVGFLEAPSDSKCWLPKGLFSKDLQVAITSFFLEFGAGLRYGGFQKLGPSLRVPILRITVYWAPFWGPVCANLHMSPSLDWGLVTVIVSPYRLMI